MARFVLEIGSEEIPAAFLDGYGREVAAAFRENLARHNLGFGELRVHVTPRRAVMLIDDLDAVQKTSEEIITGPAVAAAYDSQNMPTRALRGFLKGQGLSESDLFSVQKGKGEYVAARRRAGGRLAKDILAEICPVIISSISFPKRMRWGENPMPYARPIRWILALLDADVVPFAVGKVVSGRKTQGHRIHGRGPFEIEAAADFEKFVASACGVSLSSQMRRKSIIDGGNALAAMNNGRVLWRESLLDEVQGLVEHPVPMLGDFDASYLEIPREVLLTSMESHQKSFGIEDGNSALLPHFLTVLNISPEDPGLVKKGWERVLRARLEDARFFWKSDLAADFEDWLKKLDDVIFIGRLGSMGDKTRRLEKFCAWICSQIPACSCMEQIAARAGRLSKADLVSGMVGEFDSLQGVMGGIYAARKGEEEAVARALGEQYLPSGPDSPVPASIQGAILSLADRADTLAGCFGLGMLPTGAADPNGLRRCALGIIRIMLAFKLDLELSPLLGKAICLYGNMEWIVAPQESLDSLKNFFAGRLRNYFLAQGFDVRIVDAALNAGFENIPQCAARVEALATFSKGVDYADAVRIFKRMANILRQAGGMDGKNDWCEDLLEEEAERNLSATLKTILPELDALLDARDYAGILNALVQIRPAVDGFFENVMVMSENMDVRENRLAMLRQLGNRFARVADFSALQI